MNKYVYQDSEGNYAVITDSHSPNPRLRFVSDINEASAFSYLPFVGYLRKRLEDCKKIPVKVTRIVEVLHPCSKCGSEGTRKCKDTPSGGWGTMKCGAPLCDECECGCSKLPIF